MLEVCALSPARTSPTVHGTCRSSLTKETGGRKHLALFVYGLAGSGAQWRMVNLANAFAERGYTVDLVVVRSHGPLLQEISPLVRLVALGPRWEHLPQLRKWRGRFWLTGLYGLARYLRQARPEALLSTSYFSNVIALWARALTHVRTRLVVRVSNHLSHSAVHVPQRSRRLGVWSARRFYPWADAIVTVSHGLAEDVVCVTGLSHERITVIDNPVLTAATLDKANVPLDHPWFASGSPPVLLGVGRLVRQKDFPTLLKAFARVRAVRPVRLIILGDGRKRKTLEVLAQQLGVASDVDLPGFVLNPFPYMKQASVFVLSSAWEGLPGALVEAMACGCPVVSTNCPSGPEEILDGGAYGPLVPVGDDAALARAILAMLDSPTAAEKLRAQASRFSVARVADRYLEILFGVEDGLYDTAPTLR